MGPSFDTSVFFLINTGMTNPAFDVLMPLLSDRGYLLALPVLALAAFFALRQRSPSVLFAVIVLIMPVLLFFIADRINDLLKEIIARSRPCRVLEGVRLLAACPRSFSLPSGHAIASFAFAGSFFILTRGLLSNGWRGYVLLLAGTVAFSRVYIGVHYPLDVAVGTLLGTGLAAAVCIPLRRLSPAGKQETP